MGTPEGRQTWRALTWCVTQHHLCWRCCSPWSEDLSRPGSCCGCPGSERTLLSCPCRGPQCLRSDLPGRALRWSCATGVPPSLCLAPNEATKWRPPGRLCCRGWGRRRWYRCHCQQRCPVGSCSCWVRIPCGRHHTTSRHCGHSMHCWRECCCSSGWSSGCQTTTEASVTHLKGAPSTPRITGVALWHVSN